MMFAFNMKPKVRDSCGVIDQTLYHCHKLLQHNVYSAFVKIFPCDINHFHVKSKSRLGKYKSNQ